MERSARSRTEACGQQPTPYASHMRATIARHHPVHIRPPSPCSSGWCLDCNFKETSARTTLLSHHSIPDPQNLTHHEGQVGKIPRAAGLFSNRLSIITHRMGQWHARLLPGKPRTTGTWKPSKQSFRRSMREFPKACSSQWCFPDGYYVFSVTTWKTVLWSNFPRSVGLVTLG